MIPTISPKQIKQSNLQLNSKPTSLRNTKGTPNLKNIKNDVPKIFTADAVPEANDKSVYAGYFKTDLVEVLEFLEDPNIFRKFPCKLLATSEIEDDGTEVLVSAEEDGKIVTIEDLAKEVLCEPGNILFGGPYDQNKEPVLQLASFSPIYGPFRFLTFKELAQQAEEVLKLALKKRATKDNTCKYVS